MPLQGALSIYPGEKVLAYYRANAAPTSFRAMVRVEHTRGWEDYDLAEYDTGTLTSFTTTWVETATDSQVPSSGGTGGCIVVGGGIQIRPSATSLVKGSFYARFVVQRGGPLFEECLCCGYLYDAKPFLAIGEHADLEMSEAVAFMDATWTQANVAGGAVRVDIVPGAGSSITALYAGATNSGTNAILSRVMTALASGAEVVRLQSIGSGAGTIAFLAAGAAGTNSTNTSQGGFGPGGLPVAGTQTLQIGQTGAGAQNDTFRLLITVRVKGALPTVSKANSTNQADVTVTAGAASFAFIS